MIEEKKIMIIGGSGSLGNELIKNYSMKNKMFNVSRDENKHWEMEKIYKDKITNYICDIGHTKRLMEIVKEIEPNIIIIASALKHIERCEVHPREAINTNLLGIMNFLDAIEYSSQKPETVLLVSTDKACSPINTYGMCKGLSEKYMIDKARTSTKTRYLIVRYGNVLNSRGSIIPMLHHMGENEQCFKLTHPDMTRFIMTLYDAVKCIDYAINNSPSGSITVPKLKSMKTVDLISIFSNIYKKPIITVGCRQGEKLYETLINETQSVNVQEMEKYYIIFPPFISHLENLTPFQYNSNQNNLTKDDLITYLNQLFLLSNH